MKIETGRRPGYTIVLSYTKVAKKKENKIFEISDFLKKLFIYISTRWIDNKPCHIGYNFICSIRKKISNDARSWALSSSGVGDPGPRHVITQGFFFLYEKAERAAPAGPVIFTCLSQDITDRAHTGRRERERREESLASLRERCHQTRHIRADGTHTHTHIYANEFINMLRWKFLVSLSEKLSRREVFP